MDCFQKLHSPFYPGCNCCFTSSLNLLFCYSVFVVPVYHKYFQFHISNERIFIFIFNACLLQGVPKNGVMFHIIKTTSHLFFGTLGIQLAVIVLLQKTSFKTLKYSYSWILFLHQCLCEEGVQFRKTIIQYILWLYLIAALTLGSPTVKLQMFEKYSSQGGKY